jgi:hypothetical protein
VFRTGSKTFIDQFTQALPGLLLLIAANQFADDGHSGFAGRTIRQALLSRRC